jgi:ATP-binding cassette subfamily F protein 3
MALKQFQGMVCLITHDRHLINQIANKVIEVDHGIPYLFLGNYDDYLYKKQKIQLEETKKEVKREVKVEVKEKEKSSIKKSKYMDKEERRRRVQEMDQYRRQLSRFEKRFQEVEKSLNEATQTLDHLNQRLSDPSLYLNQKETYEAIQTHNRVKEQVNELTQLWESLALEFEEMKMANLMSNLKDQSPN